METVFITIHDLSLDARIKYCSDSVEDILGYLPHEVKGKSCWEYFHPDEIPFARAIHGRGVDLDKAAALNYCRIKHKDGSWIGCECVFTVVYDVLVASTSIYQRGPKAQRRAIAGAGVRRIFASSPRDPRYHMLSYISNKFVQDSHPHAREPRAALFLNRFTRTSTIMFATNGVANILGLNPDQLVGKSFYYCITEGCLNDAVRCLESAKGNDSIAYLRFWFRDPTQADTQPRPPSESGTDEDEDGGVAITPSLHSHSSVDMISPTPLVDGELTPRAPSNDTPPASSEPVVHGLADEDDSPQIEGDATHVGIDQHRSRGSSGNSTDVDGSGNEAVFDRPSLPAHSSASSLFGSEEHPHRAVEVEAVVSCTSDGLVVVLRRARPLVPQTASLDAPSYTEGLFVSPWALDPVMPADMQQTTVAPSMSFPSVSEPTEAGFMSAIRDVAVFAWSLTGINGALLDHAHGTPSGESLPPGGLPIWDPNDTVNSDDRYNGFADNSHRPIHGIDTVSTIQKKEEEIPSSDDEVVWKRVPQMPTWRRPKRRGHEDAFGTDGDGSALIDAVTMGSQTRRRKLDGGK